LNKTPSIRPRFYSDPKIKLIFKNPENTKLDNASLYQNILEYASSFDTGFRFTELGRWLMKKNIEFQKFYSGRKSKIPISARLAKKSDTSISERIANTRQRIQNCIDNLIKWQFLHISKMVEAEKNNTLTPLYVITPLGKIISLIVKAHFSTIDEEKFNAIKQIIDIIKSIKEQNDSAIIIFVTKLLNQLWENNKEFSILIHLERLLNLEIDNGNDFLSHLLGSKYLIYWFFVNEKIPFKILEYLSEDKRKIILFNLKTEIEYYYQQNYLLQDDNFLKNGKLINSGTISSSYWENTRIKYIDSLSKVVVPSYCKVCNSHRAFVLDIIDYLKAALRALGPYPNMLVSGNCIECKKFLSTHIISIPFSSPNLGIIL
jgi:hypothetical protein